MTALLRFGQWSLPIAWPVAVGMKCVFTLRISFNFCCYFLMYLSLIYICNYPRVTLLTWLWAPTMLLWHRLQMIVSLELWVSCFSSDFNSVLCILFLLTEYLLHFFYDSGVCQMGSQFQSSMGIQEQLLRLLSVQDLVLRISFYRKACPVFFLWGFVVLLFFLVLTGFLL